MILQVLGGTVNAGSGVLTARCSAVAADSAVAKVARLVEQASVQDDINCLHSSKTHGFRAEICFGPCRLFPESHQQTHLF